MPPQTKIVRSGYGAPFVKKKLKFFWHHNSIVPLFLKIGDKNIKETFTLIIRCLVHPCEIAWQDGRLDWSGHCTGSTHQVVEVRGRSERGHLAPAAASSNLNAVACS